MGCGCNKGRKTGAMPKAVNMTTGATQPTAKRVAVYEVYTSEGTVLTTESPTAARQEARRLGASVRVSSRAIETQDLASATPA